MPPDSPATPEPLRAFLRERFSPARIRRAASFDYDMDGDGIAEEFKRNLDTGVYSYEGSGNPYECALLQRHDMTADRPINELFGAWWLGAFCSDPGFFVLIDNLAPKGVDSLFHMVVRGCGELGEDAAAAARAAAPFVRFVHARAPDPDESDLAGATAALEAIEELGTQGVATERYQRFMRKYENESDV